MSTQLRDGTKKYLKSVSRFELLSYGIPLGDWLNPDTLKARRILKSLLAQITLPKSAFLTVLTNLEENGNASKDFNIAITTGAIENLDDDAIAFILAHEIGHLIEGIKDPSIWDDMEEIESQESQMQADKDAIELMRKAGYGKSLDSIVRQLESFNDPSDFDRIETIRHYDS